MPEANLEESRKEAVMSDVVLMAEKRAVPPMGGLAIMAAELAGKRVPLSGYRFGGMTSGVDQFSPTERARAKAHELRPGGAPLTSSEYYRIIDRIARGEKP